jgi:hypothetical protein
MSQPGPDWTEAIGAAMTANDPGVPGMPANTSIAGAPEYRVAPEGDSTPTSGNTLQEVTSAADAPDEGPGAPPDAAIEVQASPVDVTTLGGGPNQWWTFQPGSPGGSPQ